MNSAARTASTSLWFFYPACVVLNDSFLIKASVAKMPHNAHRVGRPPGLMESGRLVHEATTHQSELSRISSSPTSKKPKPAKPAGHRFQIWFELSTFCRGGCDVESPGPLEVDPTHLRWRHPAGRMGLY